MPSFIPLVHYLRFGEKEGRPPSPFFDVVGYRLQLGGEEPPSLLKHYLDGGWNKGLKPVKYFEPAYYLPMNPDVGKAGLDPYFHYLFTGYKESRRPSQQFSFDAYSKRYGLTAQSPTSPLAHFLYNNSGNDALLAATGASAVSVIANRPSDSDRHATRSIALQGPDTKNRRIDRIPGLQPKAQVIGVLFAAVSPDSENDEMVGKGVH